ncbi:MAG: methyltransferase domain-containing protein [Thermotogota bacterium]|nr:methyltransferase domain-containing protein [Thermotogota bacterium]
MIDEKLLEFLACPICKSSVNEKGGGIVCSNTKCGKSFEIIEGIPIMLANQGEYEVDMEITAKTWEKRYKQVRDEYDPNNLPEVVKISSGYTKRFFELNDVEIEKIFLEAGCGTARTSLELSKQKNLIIICLDLSLSALLKARQLFRKYTKQAYFICGDLRNLPILDTKIDYIFSDGAIEHFKETQKAINEFYRILRKGGNVLVTVPHISFSMLSLGQLHGNIPNVVVLGHFLEFIHLRVLNGRFLKNGYELSFTQAQLKRSFYEFTDVEVGLYQTFHELSWLRIKPLKEVIRKLTRNQLFCPLIYASCIKK